jgi:hypothetical protein
VVDASRLIDIQIEQYRQQSEISAHRPQQDKQDQQEGNRQISKNNWAAIWKRHNDSTDLMLAAVAVASPDTISLSRADRFTEAAPQ